MPPKMIAFACITTLLSISIPAFAKHPGSRGPRLEKIRVGSMMTLKIDSATLCSPQLSPAGSGQAAKGWDASHVRGSTLHGQSQDGGDGRRAGLRDRRPHPRRPAVTVKRIVAGKPAAATPRTRQLTPEGVNLRAMLNAFDAATAGLPPEQRRKLSEDVAAGKRPFKVSGAELARHRAAIRIGQYLGVDQKEAAKDLRTLEDASTKIPGIKGLLSILGADQAIARP